MKRTYLYGFPLAIALVTAGAARADGPAAQMLSAMIRDIEFITRNSSLEYAGQALPDVAIVSEGDLHLLLWASNAQVFAIEEGRSAGLVSAFYDRDANKIFLSDVTAATGPGLFHELVHFLQDINDKDDMFISHRVCLEAEAYDLQAIWQTEQGIDLASKPAYGFVMTLHGACNDADFSWVDSAERRAKTWAGASRNNGQVID